MTPITRRTFLGTAAASAAALAFPRSLFSAEDLAAVQAEPPTNTS